MFRCIHPSRPQVWLSLQWTHPRNQRISSFSSAPTLESPRFCNVSSVQVLLCTQGTHASNARFCGVSKIGIQRTEFNRSSSILGSAAFLAHSSFNSHGLLCSVHSCLKSLASQPELPNFQALLESHYSSCKRAADVWGQPPFVSNPTIVQAQWNPFPN